MQIYSDNHKDRIHLLLSWWCHQTETFSALLALCEGNPPVTFPSQRPVTQSFHYTDVIMSAMASQITGVSIAYSNVCSGADQRKHQSSASLAFVREIHRWPVNSPHKEPITQKMFPFDDVIILLFSLISAWANDWAKNSRRRWCWIIKKFDVGDVELLRNFHVKIHVR